MKLSVVIPARDEAESLTVTLAGLAAALDALQLRLDDFLDRRHSLASYPFTSVKTRERFTPFKV